MCMKIEQAKEFPQSNLKLIVTYFLLAYLLAWAFFIPAALESQKLIEFSFSPKIFLLFGIFAPFVSASVLTWSNDGRVGVRRLIKRGFDWNFPYYIYLFIIIAPILNALIAYLLVGGKTPNTNLLSLSGTFVIYFFLGGSFGEEFGWRGFALAKMLERTGASAAALLIGLLWATWHLPLFWIAGTSQFNTPIWLYLIYVTALSFQYTWIYLRTNGNIFACLLFHTFTNVTIEIFPIEVARGVDERFYYETLIAVVIAVILFFSERRFR